MKHLLSLRDLTKREILDIFSLAEKFKKQRGRESNILRNKVIALLFEKPSTRTRVSFEVGI